MHMHDNPLMRTTIEINDKHRAKLLELAAQRGEKGFSAIVGEAIETYLQNQAKRSEMRRRALRLRGSLSPEEGERLQRELSTLRKFWR